MDRTNHFQLGTGQLEGAKDTCAGCGKGIEIMGGDWTAKDGTWACAARKRGGGWSAPLAAHTPAPKSTKAFQLR